MKAVKTPLILVIDDDLAYLEIIGSCLRTAGFVSEIAHGPEEGMRKARALHPDLILLDMNMPGLNGTELLIDFKKDPITKNIKVAFLTTLTNPWPGIKSSTKDFARELGAVEYLDKTHDLMNIIEKVKAILAE